MSSLRSCSHWPAKFSTSASDLRVLEHPPHLAVEVLCATRPCWARRSRLVVGHGAPQEIRQPRGQLVLVERADAARIVRRWFELDAEQEVGRNQHRLHAELDRTARTSRRSARRASNSLHQPLDLVVGRGTAIGPRGEPLEDLAGALFGLFSWLGSHENDLRVRLGQVSGLHAERSDDLQVLDHAGCDRRSAWDRVVGLVVIVEEARRRTCASPWSRAARSS